MTTLVSISSTGDETRLRRYEAASGVRTCTHLGSYDSDGITHTNVEYYRARGAHQDVQPPPRNVSARPARRPA